MKAKELRTKSVNELKDELSTLVKAQFKLRMQKGMGETPKSHTMKSMRKDIARIKTILNEVTE